MRKSKFSNNQAVTTRKQARSAAASFTNAEFRCDDEAGSSSCRTVPTVVAQGGNSRNGSRWLTRLIVFSTLFVTSVAVAYQATDAETRFVRLLEQIKVAHHNGNLRDVLSISLELADLLHHSGPSTEQVAMAYAELGERRQAIDSLQTFASMGQSDNALGSMPQFSSIKSMPAFYRIVALMRKNELPIDHATTVVRFHDANLLLEDVDYDPTTRSFLVTSVLQKKIVRLRLDGIQKDFAESPDGWPMLAIKVDAQHGLVWATEVALNNFADVPSEDWGQSALLCLRLKDGILIRKINVPHAALGDMALMPNGDVIVSDGDNGGIYRARAGCTSTDLQRIDSGEFISPQTPAATSDGKHIFIPDYVRGVALFDVDTGQVRWIDARHRHAMQGIDGMYLVSKCLLAIQNGASPERVVWFGLNGELQVVGEKVINRSSPMPVGATHGVVVNGNFYYIANSGWNSLDDAGRIKSGAKMTRALIKKLKLSRNPCG